MIERDPCPCGSERTVGVIDGWPRCRDCAARLRAVGLPWDLSPLPVSLRDAIEEQALKSPAVSADEVGAMMTAEQALKILRRIEPSTTIRAHVATLTSNPTDAELAEVVAFLRAENLLRD